MFRDLSDEARRTTQRSEIAAPMPFQHINGSTTLDGILAVFRMARHLSLHCSSPNNRNRLANRTLPPPQGN